MKGPSYLHILLLLCAACTKPDKSDLYETVKLNAKNYLTQNLTDTSNYEPVGFSGPDSIVQSYRNDKIYQQFDDSIIEVEAIRFREMGENFKLFQQRKASGFYDKKQAYFKRKRDSVANVIEPEFIGYKLEHHFKTADISGVKTLKKYTFLFDEKGKLLNVLK